MQIKPMIPPELTPEIVYLRGQYALSKYTIPYFSAVVPFAFAIDKFSLIEDVPDAARIEWSLSELFQRDVVWERVLGELVRYLRNENRPQFFNSLTLALLPRSGYGFGGVYESPYVYPAMSDPALDTPVQIGGIQIQMYKGANGLAGKLRWDPKRIIVVAVDGQHRLAAIKALRERMPPEKLDISHLPVIFLIPDPKTGFVEPPLPPGTPQTISTLRQVFIDVNKNARPVSDVRNILLDDRDVVSVCVRSIIGERLSDKPEPQRIPLAIVDWMSDKKNKIEEGPFVTTVLILRDVVREAIRPPDMEDFEEEDRGVRRWLQDVFAPSAEQLVDLMSQVQRCFHLEIPLTFTPEQISVLAEQFTIRWRPYLYRVFSELTPYRQLWEYGQVQGLHAPQIANLYAAKFMFEGEEAEKRAERIVNEIKIENPVWSLEKNFGAPLKHIDGKIKNENWAFKVVFQKALFQSFLNLLRQAPVFVPESEDWAGMRNGFTTRWIEGINRLFDSPLAVVSAVLAGSRERFWAGIGLRPEGTIDFTQAGTRRIAAWLNAWVCLYWLRPEVPTWGGLGKDPRTLAEMALNALDLRIVHVGMLRVAQAQGDYSEEEAKAAAEELRKKRYEYLRKLLTS